MSKVEHKTLLISQVAGRAQVNPQTVLFYERRGLIPKPRRRPSGYREFDPETVDVIGFIQRAQELGFTLNEIAELLALRNTEGAECSDILAKARQKLHLIEAKIFRLEAMRDALDKLVRACSGRGSARDCPIIEAIQDKGRTGANDKTRRRRAGR